MSLVLVLCPALIFMAVELMLLKKAKKPLMTLAMASIGGWTFYSLLVLLGLTNVSGAGIVVSAVLGAPGALLCLAFSI